MASAQQAFAFDLFVSYAHRDDHDGWVARFVDAIREEHARFTPNPLEVFFDRADIQTMHDWEHRILGGLRHSKVMLAILSPHYFASAYCRKEWEIHIEHELDRAMTGEGIAPIYIVTAPGFEDEAQAALDAWLTNLRRRQYLDFRDRSGGPEALRREEVRRRLEGLDQRLAAQIEKAERIATSPTTIPPHNRNFVGRVEELRRLREALALGRVGAITAVHGLGGIGKSALAFEYAHAFAAEYPGGRFLVPAAGVDDLRIPIVNLAEAKGVMLTVDDRKDLAASFARVRAAFEQGPRSLLLLDNVDDPKLLAPQHRALCLPSSDHVHVLATTRLEPERLHGVECLALDALPEPDALRLLEKHRPFSGDDKREAALRIVRRLGGHPLAVEVVAVYLWQTPEVSYTDYAARLEREGLGAMEESARNDLVELSRHQQKLLSELLEPTLAKLSPPERLAVYYAALLPPDQIALPWIEFAVGDPFPEINAKPQPGYPDPWLQIKRRLLGLRLLVSGDHPHLARMHRIVQDVIGARLTPAIREKLQRDLSRWAIASVRMFQDKGWRELDYRWLVGPLRDYALRLLETNPTGDSMDLASRIARVMLLLERFDEARSLFRCVIDRGRVALGGSHPSVLVSCQVLGNIERFLGNPSEGRRLLDDALGIVSKTQGADAAALAYLYCNLGLVEHNLGNLSEARRLIRLGIDHMQKFGADPHDLANQYHILGAVERDIGNLPEARHQLCHAISIYKEKTPDDSDRSTNLA